MTNALHNLRTLMWSVSSQPLQIVCANVLADKRFQTRSGSKIVEGEKSHHHGYPGGLLIHTGEVAIQAIRFAVESRTVNPDVLITAAIFHDYGKIWDYDPDGRPTSHRNKIRHVARSYAEFMKMINGLNADPETVDAIGHAILAHHGRYEWGSPVEPQTEEAFILHLADMWSSQFGPTKDKAPEPLQ